METFQLWDEGKVPGECQEAPVIEYYPAEKKTSSATVIILPGGGYWVRCKYEGASYAKYFNTIGMDAFVVEYRVTPHKFPTQLMDARRAIRFVRFNAEKFGIDKDRVGLMGSSAGGHLTALTATYTKDIDLEVGDEIDKMDYMPNATILCYPVICSPDSLVAHEGSFKTILGNAKLCTASEYSCERNVSDTTPTAFIWHTSNDNTVNVCNSLRYGEALRMHNIPFEMHIFPEGNHGLGLASDNMHVAQWVPLLHNWLEDKGWLKGKIQKPE